MDSAPAAVQLPEARDADDNWIVLKDKSERKKRQNRLNQRAWRKRQSSKRKANDGNEAGSRYTFVIEAFGPPRPQPVGRGGHGESADGSGSDPSPFPGHRHPSAVVAAAPQHVPAGKKRLIPPLLAYRTATDNPFHPSSQGALRITFPLSPDHHLITLVQYNVLRATMANIGILGLQHIVPPSCDAQGVIVPKDGRPSSSRPSFPPDLTPTALQRTVPHPGWMDIAPDARMRDNLIRAKDAIDEDDLCDDLCGGLYEGFDDCETRGLMVWGDPWRVESWEASEGFARKWGFLLRGCRASMLATDRWRAARGEEPMDWSVVEVQG